MKSVSESSNGRNWQHFKNNLHGSLKKWANSSVDQHSIALVSANHSLAKKTLLMWIVCKQALQIELQARQSTRDCMSKRAGESPALRSPFACCWLATFSWYPKIETLLAGYCE